MNKPLLLGIVALSLSTSFATACFARNGADDGAAVDLRGRVQDVVIKRHGADNVGIDFRGRNQDTILKRHGADNTGVDLRGRGQDVLLKRQGADDGANHIRRAQGADDVNRMRHARDGLGHH
jgi:hypothetical protein